MESGGVHDGEDELVVVEAGDELQHLVAVHADQAEGALVGVLLHVGQLALAAPAEVEVVVLAGLVGQEGGQLLGHVGLAVPDKKNISRTEKIFYYLLDINREGDGLLVGLDVDHLLDSLHGGVLEVLALGVLPDLDLAVLQHVFGHGELQLLGDLAALVDQLVLVGVGGLDDDAVMESVKDQSFCT